MGFGIVIQKSEIDNKSNLFERIKLVFFLKLVLQMKINQIQIQMILILIRKKKMIFLHQYYLQQLNFHLYLMIKI
jgi:hypothetical protein